MSPSTERKKLGENHNTDSKNGRENSFRSKLITEKSRTLKWEIQQYKPMQVWDWLFKSCEVNGRVLLHDGLITLEDIEECMLKGNCKKLGVQLPAWSILQCLLESGKVNSSGLVISDHDVELTRMNGPRDKVFEWFVGPLLVIKEQLKRLHLDESEENCLRELVIRCRNEKPEEWDGTEFASSDRVRRAQLQSIIRRLQGIVASMSRIPTFRRRFRNLVKLLYIETLQASASANHMREILKDSRSCIQSEDEKGSDDTLNKEHRTYDNGNVA